MAIKFNKFPYFDDYSEDDLVYQLLFQPGRAVQARELTQIQSLLQNQIEKLGKHLFKDGARIYGGRVSYDRTNTNWLALTLQDINGEQTRIREFYPGLIIKKPSASNSGNSEYEGRIVSVFPAEANDPNTLLFKWNKKIPEHVREGFLPNEILHLCDPVTGATRYVVTTMDISSSNKSQHIGTASSITVDPGVYFWKGLFIKTTGGSVILNKYNNISTYRVGYALNEHVAQNDPKSLDPASHAPNYGAPGADRFKIDARLLKVGDGVTLDPRVLPDFIEVARIEGGFYFESQDGIHSSSIYAVLGDQLAKRTYDESGNYVVNPYKLQMKDKTVKDNPKMVAHMSEGVSYVKGYRHSLNHPYGLEIDKGRDVLTESLDVSNRYGDNFLAIYDEANTSFSAHIENANGMFVLGSGGHSPDVGNRGEAVSVHCVPQHLVINHSLASVDKWNSTLVGTARPIQMSYNTTRSTLSHAAGRSGDVYNLWLDDFQASPISNTVSVTNIISGASAYANATLAVFHFDSQTHGITANDRISVTGATTSAFNVDHFSVVNANTTAIVTANGNVLSSGETASLLTITRTTGNTSPYKTVVLDQGASAAWNGSYVGATITVTDSSGNKSLPRRVVDYIGTDSRAETLYNTENGYSKRATVILDNDLEVIPKYGDTYNLILGMKQARSVAYNQNKSGTGVEQFPALLHQSWNIDPVTGIEGGNRQLLGSELYGNRIDGDSTYNKHGESVAGEDALLLNTGRAAVKSLMPYGDIDDEPGFTAGELRSNTTIVYTEYARKVGSARSSAKILEFTTDGSSYDFFDRPLPGMSATSTKATIKENVILVNETTGQVITDDIASIGIGDHAITITLDALTYTDSGSVYYGLYFPVKALLAQPAYKKLVTANLTVSDSGATALDSGQVVVASGSYSDGAGSVISLLKPDGFKLQKVVHDATVSSGGAATADLIDSSKDITDRFDFDSGQRDMFYDNASIVLKSGVRAPIGNLIICFDYFKRMNKQKSDAGAAENDSPSYFSVDSYQHTTDLLLDHASDPTRFATGTKLTSNSGATGYVVDYANTTAGGYAKVRLTDVKSTFVVDEYVDGYSGGSLKSSQVVKITTADLKYSEIPVYKGKSTHYLRNMIDFRSYVSTSSQVSDTIANSMMSPIPSRSHIRTGRSNFSNPMATSVELDHYAGRIDKVTVTEDGNFAVNRGNPAVNPFPPRDTSDGSTLTIYTLEIPPYTFDPSNVRVKENPARRHTMKDIGRLAKRVENLEYYVSLNALEMAASELDISFADGTSRFKNGIVVDNFTSHSVHAPGDRAVALGQGVLRPLQIPYDPGAIMLNAVVDTYDGVVQGCRTLCDDIGIQPEASQVVTLSYTVDDSLPLIMQPAATSSESVNPYDIQNYTGDLRLTPDFDRWISTKIVPEYNSSINQLLNGIFAGLDENSTDTEINAAFGEMDDFWQDIAGATLGDDIVGSVTQLNEAGTELETIDQNITLGNPSVMYLNTSSIDSAIAQHGILDGMTANIKILPYIRSRDFIVHATGLKPNHLSALSFDGVGGERYFGQATKIYMKYDKHARLSAGSGTNGRFLPDRKNSSSAAGSYEKIKLEGGGVTANGILIAIRNPDYMGSQSASEKLMVGYVVPEFDSETGKVDYDGLRDGYYSSTNEALIAAGGWQGGSPARTITGYTSGAVAYLTSGGTEHYYNGHYTGTVRAYNSGTRTITLSGDAHRYVAKNFTSDSDVTDEDSRFDGIPEECSIKIIAGTGVGQEGTVEDFTVHGTAPKIILAQTAGGSTGITATLDTTSVYTIGMESVNPEERSHEVTQIGGSTSMSTHYGDRIGIFHIPELTRTKFPSGRKLVEILDRYSKEEWLVGSYASAYYTAQGQERDEVEASADGLGLLSEIRSRANLFRIEDHPTDLGYVPATNNLTDVQGRIAVVVGIDVENGAWTAPIDYIPGGGEYGTISAPNQNLLNDNVTGVWKWLKDNHPSVYNTYYSELGTSAGVPWIDDSEYLP